MVRVVASALLVYLVLVAPVRGQRRFARLKRALQTDPSARSRFYRSATLHKSILTVVAIVLYVIDGRRAIGLPIALPDAAAVGLVVWLVVAVAAGAMLLRKRLASDDGRAKLARAARRWIDLLPATRDERRNFVSFAIGAGITEEILYRAFVFGYLLRAFPDAGRGTLMLVTAAAFGLNHFYQGPKGALIAAIGGASLGWCALTAGLIAAIAIHALVDLRLLLIPADLVQSLTGSTLYDENGTVS
jgi:membrane protease YdiL (CAAX protease family)